MSWQVYAVISVITNSVANLLSRVLMKDKKSDPVLYAIIFQFLLGLFAVTFALILGKFRLPTFDITLFRFVISAFLWAGSTVFTFKAVKHLTAGESTILGSSASLISIPLGIVFLKEILTLKLVIGAMLILFSVIIVSYENASFSSKKGVLFALIAAVCAGIAVVNETVILKTYDSFSYTGIISFLPGVILLFVFPHKTRLLLKTKYQQQFIKTMLVLSFVYVIQAITYYLALENKAPISILSPFFRSSVVLTIFLAFIFLKEKTDVVKKITASILTIMGSMLLG